jgi:hypothetical protein
MDGVHARRHGKRREAVILGTLRNPRQLSFPGFTCRKCKKTMTRRDLPLFTAGASIPCEDGKKSAIFQRSNTTVLSRL